MAATSATAAPADGATKTARLALACLDLTSLNDGDTEAEVARLCERADGVHGRVAAVCVWPRFAAFARANVPPAMQVAAVANFPAGGADVQQAVRDTAQIVQAGAQEVDVVLPWRALMAGDERACAALLEAVRRECEGLRLKVILESGELGQPSLIRRASVLAIAAGADFLKTSTGKTPVNATPEAAQAMLGVIATNVSTRNRVGFKASGGIRTVADVAVYAALVEQHLGAQALGPARFRIGASALLGDIEAVLSGARTGSASPGSY
jgi:deoxyribose-phosphate aldolase